MATLANQKVKDAYTSLLKLESGTATSSTKVIEDGAGNDTALKLSTVAVEIDGTLIFGTLPTTGTTETSALFLDGSGNIVRRTLGAAAFTSGASLSATAPIDITGDVVSLNAPTTLSQLNSATVATADTFFIYDATATAHKYITLGDLTTYMGNSITVAAAGSNGNIQYNNAGARAGATTLNYSSTQLVYTGNEIVNRSATTDTGLYLRTGNVDVANGATNTTMFTIEWANLSAARIFYTAYNVDSSIKIAGDMYVTWDTVNGLSSDIDTTIRSNIGADISTKLTFNTTISASSVLVRVATNTTGETYYIRFSVELIKAF